MKIGPWLSIIAVALAYWLLSLLAVFYLTAPNWLFDVDFAQRHQAPATLIALSGSLERFHKAHGRYPTMEEGLRALKCGDKADYCIRRTYDPWGNEVRYRVPARYSKAGFDLWIEVPSEHGEPSEMIGNW